MITAISRNGFADHCIKDEYVDNLKQQIPELPNKRTARFMKDYGISYGEALLLVDNQEKAALFEQTAALKKASAKAICNWILGDITRYMNETGKLIADTKLSSEKLSYLIECIESGKFPTPRARLSLRSS